MLILGLVLGGWGYASITKYLSQRGCYQLPYDFVSIDLPTPAKKTVQFVFMGDIGTRPPGNSDQRQVATGILSTCNRLGCDFVLLLGDNFMEKGVQSVNDPLLAQGFEQVYHALDLPFIAVLGNHDVKGNVLAQVAYSLKNPQWLMPNYRYQFEAGSAHFIALNTSCHLWGWLPLRQMLPEKSSKWNIVYGHHPVYSGGFHGDNELQVHWFWQSFLQEKVDFYLSGHNHQLEHLKYEEDETDYIVSGAGGGHYRSSKAQARLRSSNYAKSLFHYPDNGFVWMSLSESHADVRFFDANGKKIYQFLKRKSQ